MEILLETKLNFFSKIMLLFIFELFYNSNIVIKWSKNEVHIK